MANPTFVYYPNSTSLEFDVLLSASENSYLDYSLMRLSYNPEAFGPRIASSGVLTITKYPSFAAGYYSDPISITTDYSNSVVTIPFSLRDYTESPVNRTLVGTTPTKFLRINILILDCTKQSDIGFTDVDYTKEWNLFVATNPASFLSGNGFDDAYYSGTISPNQLCKPNITSIDPTTVTAGTNSKITIEGFGFGNTKGNGAVVLKNADANGISTIDMNDNVDVIWSDTKIEYTVPSGVNATNDFSGSCSGSGNVIVKENTGKSSISNFQLYVPYSILNITSVGRKYPVFPAQKPSNPDGKVKFYLTEELYNKADFKKLVEDAIFELSCVTSVNFELAGKVPDNMSNISKDGTSVISLVNDDVFDDGVTLMTTNRSVTETCTSGSLRWFINAETDIAIKRSVNWSTTGSSVDLPTGQFDFYGAILHELGHAAGLDHVISNYELMKPFADKGFILKENRMNYLNGNLDQAKEGIDWLFTEGDKFNYTGTNCQTYYKMTKKGICAEVGIIDEQFAMEYFAVLNNPVSELEALIKVGTNYQGATFDYELLNMQGQSLSKGSVIAGSNVAIPLDGLQPNLYFVTLTAQNNKKRTFKVMKQ